MDELSEWEPAFDWRIKGIDVAKLRGIAKDLNRRLSPLQESYLNEIGDMQSHVSSVIAENVDTEGLKETRPVLMRKTIILAECLGWQLTSGHLQAMSGEVTPHPSGVVEASALYDSILDMEDTVKESRGSDRLGSLISYDLRVGSGENVTTEELLRKINGITILLKNKREELTAPAVDDLEELSDPLESFMASNRKEVVSDEREALKRDIETLERVLRTYENELGDSPQGELRVRGVQGELDTTHKMKVRREASRPAPVASPYGAHDAASAVFARAAARRR